MFLKFSKLLKVTILFLISHLLASHQLPPTTFIPSILLPLSLLFFCHLCHIPFFFSPFSVLHCNPHFFFNISRHSSTAHYFLPFPYRTSRFIFLQLNIFNFTYHNENIKLKIDYNGCNYKYLQIEM